MQPQTIKDVGLWTVSFIWPHGELCSQTVISESVPEPTQWDPQKHESFLFLMQCSLRAWRSSTFSFGLRSYPLPTDTSPDSLNLLMILYPVDGGLFKVFAILCWGTFLWNCSTIFRCSLSQIGESLFVFTSKRLCLSEMLLWYCCQLP